MPVLTASGKNVGFQLGRGQEVTKFSELESSIPGRLPGYVSFSSRCTDCSSPLKVSERIDFHCSSLLEGSSLFVEPSGAKIHNPFCLLCGGLHYMAFHCVVYLFLGADICS